MGSFLNALSIPHAKACNRPFPMISGMILGTQNGNMRGEKGAKKLGQVLPSEMSHMPPLN